MRDSNVVICSIGSKTFYDNEEDFVKANVDIPKTIAKCVADNPKVKRFIYISAAGADPNSPSHRLRTKWAGENAVKKIYPDVTILRPTVMQQTFEQNETFTGKWSTMMKMWNRTMIAVDGANGLIQPVYTGDVATAALNCLRMDESIGQTYDLGGPHTYTYNEIYEQYFNMTQIKPYIIPVKLEVVQEYMRKHRFTNLWRYMGKYWMYPEWIVNECVDITADPDAKGFKDLHVVPVSFGQKSKEYIQDVNYMYNTHEDNPRDSHHL